MNADKQIGYEGEHGEDICPHNIADNEYWDLYPCHQDGLQSPGVELPLYTLCQRHYQIANGYADYEKGDVVTIVHFLNWPLDISGADSPREDTDENIDKLGNYGRAVGCPAIEVPFGKCDYLL